MVELAWGYMKLDVNATHLTAEVSLLASWDRWCLSTCFQKGAEPLPLGATAEKCQESAPAMMQRWHKALRVGSAQKGKHPQDVCASLTSTLHIRTI